MTETILGKITHAKFGTIGDYPFLMGMDLQFKLSGGSCVGTGGKYTVNISESCRAWSGNERSEAIVKMVEFVHQTLNDATVGCVHDLIGKPVEVTIEGNTFKNFRILTEVL